MRPETMFQIGKACGTMAKVVAMKPAEDPWLHERCKPYLVLIAEAMDELTKALYQLAQEANDHLRRDLLDKIRQA